MTGYRQIHADEYVVSPVGHGAVPQVAMNARLQAPALADAMAGQAQEQKRPGGDREAVGALEERVKGVVMNRSLLPVNYAVAIAIALSLAACGGGGGGGEAPPTQNRAPVISSAATASVEENEALDYTVTASDPDAGDTLSFSLGGPDAGVFRLDAASGELGFVSPPDYEQPADADADNVYELELSVSDGAGGSASQALSVSVTDQSILELKLDYPTPNANLGGLVSDTAVTGRVVDLEDGDVAAGDVQFVDVNGKLAELDLERSGRWRTRVAVEAPVNELLLNTTSVSGHTHELRAQLQNQALIVRPFGITEDSSRDRLVVVDRHEYRVVAINLESGKREVLFEDDRQGDDGFYGGPPPWIAMDSRSNTLYGVNLAERFNSFQTVYGLDLQSGERSHIPQPGLAEGVDVFAPQGLVLDAEADRLLVLNAFGPAAVLAWDLVDQRWSIVSGADVGIGVSLVTPFSIALDEQRNRALISDQSSKAIVAVDLASGNRTVLTSPDSCCGPTYDLPQGLTVDVNGNRVLFTDFTSGSLLAADLRSGNRILLANAGTGEGHDFMGPLFVASDSNHDRAYVVDIQPGLGPSALVVVDLATGERTAIGEERSGLGPVIEGEFQGLALDADDNRLIGTPLTGGVMSIDLDSGDRRMIADEATLGDQIAHLSGIVTDPSADRAIAYTRLGVGDIAITAIDLESGELTLLSGNAKGTGPSFQSSRMNLALDLHGRRVLVPGSGLELLMGVDLTSGDRTVLSGFDVGSGPAPVEPSDIALDSRRGRVLISNWEISNIIEIDLVTGNRSTFFQQDLDDGNGFHRFDPIALHLDSVNDRLLAVGRQSSDGSDFRGLLMSFDLRAGQRSLISGMADGARRGAGPRLSSDAYTMAVDEVGRRAFLLAEENFRNSRSRIVVVELESGERAIASR